MKVYSKVNRLLALNNGRRLFGSLTVPEKLDFPYRFENQSPLITTRANTNMKMLEGLQGFLRNNTHQLQEGFTYAYLALLQSLAKFDYDAVSSGCEYDMFRAFADSMDKMRNQGY